MVLRADHRSGAISDLLTAYGIDTLGLDNPEARRRAVSVLTLHGRDAPSLDSARVLLLEMQMDVQRCASDPNPMPRFGWRAARRS